MTDTVAGGAQMIHIDDNVAALGSCREYGTQAQTTGVVGGVIQTSGIFLSPPADNIM
jgi:hypothetical protein